MLLFIFVAVVWLAQTDLRHATASILCLPFIR